MSVNRASEVWKEIKPFAMRDLNILLDDSKSGNGSDELYAIILYDESTQKIKHYSMSDDGLEAALGAASSGDVVFVPAGTITGVSWSIPAGVKLTGMGRNTCLSGVVTNNGILSLIKIVGNLVNTGIFTNILVESSSGTGLLSTGGSGTFSEIQMSGGDYGIQLTPAGVTHATLYGIQLIHAGGTHTAVLINGENATAYFCRFAGEIGGIVRNAKRIGNCVFECTGGDAFIHDIGIATVNNSFFHAQNDIGIGLNVSASGLTLSDCSWTQGNIGLGLVTLEDGDRAKYNHTHDEFNVSMSHEPFAENAAFAQTIPTSDGSGDAIHPSLIDTYIALGDGVKWNGYRYWLAVTPFPNGDSSLENPEILVSNDGISWEVPSELINPIQEAPVTGHLADTELILGKDNKLYCFYINVADGALEDPVIICCQSSSDGITWSVKTEVLSLSDIANPVVLWDGVQYVMWYINYGSAPYTLKKRTSSSLTSGWSSEISCTLNNVPSGELVWHFDIVKRGNVYHGVFTLYDDPKPIFFGYSEDGEDWYLLDEPLLEVGASGSWDDGFLYRATLVPIHNGYDMWYSANDQLGAWANCGIGRTTIYLNSFGGMFTDDIWKSIGDLAVGSGDLAAKRLAVGTNGQALIADNTEPLGVKWESIEGEKVKVSSDDTTAGYLNGKLVAGSNITLTENNDGDNETLTISATVGAGEVLLDADGEIITDDDGDWLYEF